MVGNESNESLDCWPTDCFSPSEQEIVDVVQSAYEAAIWILIAFGSPPYLTWSTLLVKPGGIEGIFGNGVSLAALRGQMQTVKNADGFLHQVFVTGLDIASLVFYGWHVGIGWDKSWGWQAVVNDENKNTVWVYLLALSDKYFGEIFYQVSRTMAQFYLVGMSLDRLQAIVEPMGHGHVNQRRRLVIFVSVTTVVALAAHAHEITMKDVKLKPGVGWDLSGTGSERYSPVKELAFLLVFLRLGGTLLLGVLLAWTVRAYRGVTGGTNAVLDINKTKTLDKTLVRLCLAQVTLTLIGNILWAAYRVSKQVQKDQAKFDRKMLTISARLGQILAASLNFLVYAVVSRSFRGEVYRLIVPGYNDSRRNMSEAAPSQAGRGTSRFVPENRSRMAPVSE